MKYKTKKSKKKKGKHTEWGDEKWEKNYYGDIQRYRRNPFL
jgi:hypothetical protein